jgi:hypothetical protein
MESIVGGGFRQQIGFATRWVKGEHGFEIERVRETQRTHENVPEHRSIESRCLVRAERWTQAGLHQAGPRRLRENDEPTATQTASAASHTPEPARFALVLCELTAAGSRPSTLRSTHNKGQSGHCPVATFEVDNRSRLRVIASYITEGDPAEIRRLNKRRHLSS